MKAKLIPIGNSKGVRIPASVIKACGLCDELEMHVENGVILLAPARHVREEWGAAFHKMATAGDDAPVIPEAVGNDFDTEDWAW